MEFDVRNEVGFYFGDDNMTKDAALIYVPFHHQLVSRAGAERVDVSELTTTPPMVWQTRRRPQAYTHIRRNP